MEFDLIGHLFKWKAFSLYVIELRFEIFIARIMHIFIIRVYANALCTWAGQNKNICFWVMVLHLDIQKDAGHCNKDYKNPVFIHWDFTVFLSYIHTTLKGKSCFINVITKSLN